MLLSRIFERMQKQVEFVIKERTVTEDSDGKTIPVFCLTAEARYYILDIILKL